MKMELNVCDRMFASINNIREQLRKRGLRISESNLTWELIKIGVSQPNIRIPLKSPWRYVGGKTRLAKRILPHISSRLELCKTYAEPFIGGGSMLMEMVNRYPCLERFRVNDSDRAVSAFWICMCSQRKTRQMLELIMATTATVENHDRAREWMNSPDLVMAGFAALFRSRTGISGILTAGPMGGKRQRGPYKIDCRYNSPDLRDRVWEIHRQISTQMHVTNLDFQEFISNTDQESVLYYLDPPYVAKGGVCYRESMTISDHERLAHLLRQTSAQWVLSYDDCHVVRQLYDWADIYPFTAKYTASSQGSRGNELIICKPMED